MAAIEAVERDYPATVTWLKTIREKCPPEQKVDYDRLTNSPDFAQFIRADEYQHFLDWKQTAVPAEG